MEFVASACASVPGCPHSPSHNTGPQKTTELLPAYLKKEAPDVLALNETKLQDKDAEAFDAAFPGYEPHHAHSSNKKAYAGVALYVKKGIPIINVQDGVGMDSHDDEGRVLTLVRVAVAAL